MNIRKEGMKNYRNLWFPSDERLEKRATATVYAWYDRDLHLDTLCYFHGGGQLSLNCDYDTEGDAGRKTSPS